MKYEKSLAPDTEMWRPDGPALGMPNNVSTAITADGMYKFYPASGMYITVSNAQINYTPSFGNGAYIHYYQNPFTVYMKAGDHFRTSSNLGAYQRFFKQS